MLDDGMTQAAGDLARLRDARLTHVREAEQPLLTGVDRVIGVGGEQDRCIRIAAQDAPDRLHDRGRLAGARRPLDHVELARPHAHDAGDGLRLLLVWIG